MNSAETADTKTDAQGFDIPLSDPSGDLLDMDKFAQALATYIRLRENKNFTVGIFGEWGEGKTTLVQFLCHHLMRQEKSSSQKPIRFISFPAWPHTTSEKLWRALILKIAQVLLKESYEAQKKAPPDAEGDTSNSTGWLNAIARFLSGDAFVFKAAPAASNEYVDLVEKLDSTDYGKVSKRSASPQLDEEATMMAVAQGALTVLGTVSPLVAGLRSLLGIGPSIDAGKLIRDKNETSRQTIESLPRFQQIFGEMVNEKAKDGPIYVFIDDLDRAQPDVALDIMESIRIALSDVSCVFIIAVDERLIAQGLRLRYKELFAQENAAAFASKGQEYLEKIIQFRTRVPPRTSEQIQRFIAAQFPQWMPAGDIIQAIAGNNPRRIKQYCERLTFQYMIGASPFTLGFRPDEEAATDPAEPVSKTPQELQDIAAQPENAEPTLTESDDGSDVVSLSRKLRGFREEELRDLFLYLNLSYGDLTGEPIDRANKVLAEFKKQGELHKVRDAMKRVNPRVFDDQPNKESERVSAARLDTRQDADAQPENAESKTIESDDGLDVVSLSRKLRGFQEEELRELFLYLELNYADLTGEPIDRANKILGDFKKRGELHTVRDAMKRLKPEVFDK